MHLYSLSTGVAKHDDQIENHKADNSDENPVNIVNMEGHCELLSEASMDESMASGSWNSLGLVQCGNQVCQVHT